MGTQRDGRTEREREREREGEGGSLLSELGELASCNPGV